MAKLYPPYIEGTLPAFCLKDGDGEISIPFAHNKAVSKEDITGMYVKVKTVQNDVLINSGPVDTYDLTECVAKITVSNGFAWDDKWPLTIGQYYKIQIAYDCNGIVGYYSTVGVIKCTSKPDVTIVGLDENTVNNNQIEFIGQYKQEVDVTEKVYSSKFVITDLQGNEIASTGDVLHNVENNPNSYISIDTMMFNRDLEYGEIYKIKYEVTTNNGLVEPSPEYLLTQQKSLNMELRGSLKASLNFEEGYIDISIVGAIDPKTGAEEIANGAFVLSREDSLNPGYWDTLTRFAFQHESPTKIVFRDFTIEQGKTYTYSIQQYNENKVYSARKKSNTIYADFEDMFLFDGERQLKLRFNPQVSSFKTQLAETRAETIGSKYPFFFRNARVEYKIFPIAGLISMLIDNNEYFTSYEDILREKFPPIRTDSLAHRKLEPDVYDYKWEINKNYTSERLFKLKVLDWFNNGKVKLFKSPAEGNYLVRLMDTSLAPQDPLGRMIHTINSTAYECAICNYNNMIKYDIIKETVDNETLEKTYVINWREESVSESIQAINDYNDYIINELEKDPSQRGEGD